MERLVVVDHQFNVVADRASNCCDRSHIFAMPLAP
jgi:hypothetical protein